MKFQKGSLIRNTGRTHFKKGFTPWNKDRNILIKKCLMCEKDIRVSLSRMNDNRGKFCSKECSNKNRSGKGKKKINCLNCNKEFIVNKSSKIKYCCRKCSDLNRYNNKRLSKICPVCSTSFITTIKNPRNYCSRKCFKIYFPNFIKGEKNYFYGKHVYGKDHPQWKGGLTKEPYSPLFNLQLKEKIRVRDNFKCQLCDIPELELKSRLRVHHIDYDKQNSDLDNLIALCVNCHAKTNHKRDYWTNLFKNKMLIKKGVVNEV